LGQIEKTNDEYMEFIKADEHTVEQDIDFHLAILHSTKNPFVIRIGETILLWIRVLNIRKSMFKSSQIL
jgi:DNA-binding FadR family transcriptional regulator